MTDQKDYFYYSQGSLDCHCSGVHCSGLTSNDHMRLSWLSFISWVHRHTNLHIGGTRKPETKDETEPTKSIISYPHELLLNLKTEDLRSIQIWHFDRTSVKLCHYVYLLPILVM